MFTAVRTESQYNVSLGYYALRGEKDNNLYSNVAIGTRSLFNLISGNKNVSIGYQSEISLVTGSDNVSIGSDSLSSLTSGTCNISIGKLSGKSLTSGNNNIFIGSSAGETSGNSAENVVCIGYQTVFTGSNQFILGNSNSNVYSYAPLQVRYDERDMTSVRNSSIGLNFINQLHPVDFKWKYRDSSVERNRYHQCITAQDVKRACDVLQIEFGGYQDHLINGGDDVKSLGAEELLAPIIKAIQELSKRIEYIEQQHQISI
jgi:hypothetical protein